MASRWITRSTDDKKHAGSSFGAEIISAGPAVVSVPVPVPLAEDSAAAAMELTAMQKQWLRGGSHHSRSGSLVSVGSSELMPPPVLPVPVPPPPPPQSRQSPALTSPPPPIARQDSFANCSVVSSLSGDDGQSVAALGISVDVAGAAEGERDCSRKSTSAGPANARLPFRKKSALSLNDLDTSVEVSLSLSASSEETIQTGSVQAGSMRSHSHSQSCSLPPPPSAAAHAQAQAQAQTQTPFLDGLLDRKQRQLSSLRQKHRNLTFPTKTKTKRNVSAGESTSAAGASTGSRGGGSHKRQLSAHAPLRDRLGLDNVLPPAPVLRRPSLDRPGFVNRSRSSPVPMQQQPQPQHAMQRRSHSQRRHGGGGAPPPPSSGASSVGSASHGSAAALSCSAALLSSVGTPPRPSGRIPRTQSNASLSSYQSTSTYSYQSGSASDAICVPGGGGGGVGGARRRNAHEACPYTFGATPSPELLAGRPMRQSHRRVRSASNVLTPPPVPAVGTEDARTRRALNVYNTKNDTQCCQSYREAELRKVTSVVKGEIKHKLGKIVPGLHRRSQSGGDRVQLQRASGCLT